MLTNNFRAVMATILERCGVAVGLLPIVAYNGTTYYLTTAASAYPASLTTTFALSAGGAGICVGSGSATPTAADYQLENQITSGISAVVVASAGLDSGNPYCTYDLSITNTGDTAVTIREIGYRQNLHGATSEGATSGSNRVCLLDRTVLGSPITIAPGSIGVIRYTLKTIVG